MKPFIMVIYVMFADQSNLEGIAYTTHNKFPTIESCQLFGDMLTTELTRFEIDVKVFCEQMEGVGQ